MAVLEPTPVVINGTDGPDTLSAAHNGDTIFAGAGDDTVTFTIADVHGGAGNDTLRGSEGHFYGDDGDDKLIGGGDEDIMWLDGGAGNDTIDGTEHILAIVTYTGATGGITVNLNDSGPQTIGGGQGVDVIANVDAVIGTPYNDVILGSVDRDTFDGGPGNDRIDGGPGDDTFIPSLGADTLIGGDGSDTIDFSAGGGERPGVFPIYHTFSEAQVATSGITIDLSKTGPQDLGGGFGSVVLSGIENVMGSYRADLIIGDDNDNRLYGVNNPSVAWQGADTIYGGGGNDTVIYGYGFVSGGDGNDTLNGGGSVYGDAGDDVITGSGVLRGGTGADTMTGDNGFDDMLGNQGNDLEHGGNGNDWVVGGQDQDLLFGDNGNDIVYGNLGSDTQYGGAGDDWVRGGQGDDVIYGDDGNDFMAGDRGDDTVTGGKGADTFCTFGEAGLDRVTDFNRAEGDRVVVQSGYSWTVAQEGADTVIHVQGGATMVLVGVTLSALSGDWITAG